jgi:diketogulonate reductase-like aldo/keto reductase
MSTPDASTVLTLRNGLSMPTVGLGVWQATGDEAENAVTMALEAGYRLIDTAAVYGNETEVGNAIRRSGVAREEIFLTTKLWNEDQGYETTLAGFERSLERLGLEYVDLYLVHWPFSDFATRLDPSAHKRSETWKAMEEILASGKAKSIGVSNYTIEHLEEMQTYAQTLPAVNQIEFHPFWFRKELMDCCHAHDIVVEDYSPLSRGTKLQDERITAIAKKHGKSNAQIVLRWALQHGNVVIPKSVHRERIAENIDLFGFSLDAHDMASLDGLNENFSIIFGKM